MFIYKMLSEYVLSSWLWSVTFGTSFYVFLPLCMFYFLYFFYKENLVHTFIVPIVIQISAFFIHTALVFLLSMLYTPAELSFNRHHHMVNYLFYSTVSLLFIQCCIQALLYIFWCHMLSYSKSVYLRALLFSGCLAGFLSYQFIRFGLVSCP